ncbi:MAG: dnaB [Rhodocyclales bacterium]|nr:dnaB [Rhodocyclales bacterium]
MNARNQFDEMDSAMPVLRMPPHSIEAEQSLLGGLMMDNAAWDRVADVLREADFYRGEHRTIFRHIALLIERGLTADILTVSESLERKGEAQHECGLAYLSEMANNTPSTANIRQYANIVRERAIQRHLIQVGDEIAGGAFEKNGRDIGTMLDEAESKILAIRDDGRRKASDIQAIQPVLGRVVERIQELYSRGETNGLTGVSTGLIDVDQLTFGLQPTDMIIVAGRPGMGKTAFALRIAESVALKANEPALIFSMEMPADQLSQRFISSVGDIPLHNVRSGNLQEQEWQQMTYALGKLHEAPIYIDETGGLNPTTLRARARRLYRQCGGKLGVIVVDYLQLMTTTRDGENRATELSEISRAIKNLAKELQVPIVALSQLNRGLEARQNKRPMPSDLRESGALEQDADLIFFVYRDEVYNPDTTDKGTAEIILAKHRNGETGMRRVAWKGRTASFHDLDPNWKQSNIQYSGYTPPED